MTAVGSPGSGETLQQQLRRALFGELTDDAVNGQVRVPAVMEMFNYAVWPIIEAAVAAARVGTAEEIAEAIEAVAAQVDVLPDSAFVRGYQTALDQVTEVLRDIASAARSVGGVPETEKP